jgi:hypothetical protein
MHPTEETLSEYVDGLLQQDERERIEEHLRRCGECTLTVAELQHLISAAGSLPSMDPPPAVWQRIKWDLSAQPVRRRFGQWNPAWGLATAALVVLAFLAGRVIEQRQQAAKVTSGQSASAAPASGSTATTAADTAIRERVLLVAVGDHLERSQMVLVELANAEPHGQLDISAERQFADELLASNRLYRQTAVQLGQTNVADLLDELEPVLVEVARGPSLVSMQQLADIRQRIEAQGILFKVKIIGAEMRERQNVPVPAKKAPIS